MRRAPHTLPHPKQHPAGPQGRANKHGGAATDARRAPDQGGLTGGGSPSTRAGRPSTQVRAYKGIPVADTRQGYKRFNSSPTVSKI